MTGNRATIRKKKLFLQAYDRSLGNVSAACKHAKISRKCFYDWKKADSEFADLVWEVDEEMLDFSETMLKKNVREGKEASIFFHLKTKGKSRGYVEQLETKEVDNPWIELAKKSFNVTSEQS